LFSNQAYGVKIMENGALKIENLVDIDRKVYMQHICKYLNNFKYNFNFNFNFKI